MRRKHNLPREIEPFTDAAWADYFKGKWQREAPGAPGEYRVANCESFRDDRSLVLIAHVGELWVEVGGKYVPPEKAWKGWWWSKSLPPLPPPPV